ncbi:MAG: Ser-Thr-rich GPI-anchored membrane family protein [Bacteroidota bacterium]
MRYISPLLLVLFFFQFSLQVRGQKMSPTERLEAIVQSIQIIREFESLLNNLSDVGTSETIGEILIRNSYSPGRNQIFYNESVVLEDDIHPNRALGKLPIEDVDVQQYLQDFSLFYEKNSRRTVSFQNIRELSDIEEGNYKFLQIYFESQFSGKHQEIPVAYKATKRVAEIRVEREGNSWRPYIAGVSYFVEEVVEESPAVSTTKSVDPTSIENDPVAVTPSSIDAGEEIPVEQPSTGITFKPSEAYQFTYPNAATTKKPGENLSISWLNQQNIPGPIELKLMRQGRVIKTLVPQYTQNSFGWNIEKSTKKGVYQLEVRSKNTPDSYGLSPRFRIKSKFPLWLAIGIPVVIGGGAAALFLGNGGDGGGSTTPPPDNTLPPAPDPN